jgi:hypothetical protein
MTSCEECGYVYEELAVAAISETLRNLPHRYREAVAGSDGPDLSVRPTPNTWSALEYICHVRDVFLVQRERVVLAQVEDVPSFARMYRDERVELCGYDGQSAAAVLAQVELASELCALAFERIEGPTWGRRFVYNWPAAAENDLAWLGRHTVHEGQHHLMDVRQVLGLVRALEAASVPSPTQAT